MKPDFIATSSIGADGFFMIQSRSWLQRGIIHGFVGQGVSFSGEQTAGSWTLVNRNLGLAALALPRQMHGVSLWRVPERIPPDAGGIISGPEADAVLADGGRSKGIAVGVRTADCVPILVSAGKIVMAIHAGWRGLAEGVVQKALQQVDSGGQIEVLIGPCAGPARYEVGPEVLDALGPLAVCLPNPPRKEHFLLFLEESAERAVREVCGARAVVRSCGVCTISDRSFHSHRRDAEAAGRNLAFVATPW